MNLDEATAKGIVKALGTGATAEYDADLGWFVVYRKPEGGWVVFDKTGVGAYVRNTVWVDETPDVFIPLSD